MSESSVRLPSLAASLLVLALVVITGAQAFGWSAAWTAAIALATSQQWIASSVTARVDMVLAAAVSIAMFSFLRARLDARPWPNMFWAGVALAILAKGPVGLVLSVLCVTAFLLATKDLAYAKTIRPLHAALLLAIPFAWYLLAWSHAGNLFVHKILSENFYRMVDVDAGEDLGHRHSFLFYVPALFGGLAPWSVLLPAVAAMTWKEREHLGEPRIFAATWLATTFAFFTLAGSKRPVYLLSAYPAACLLIGEWLAQRFGDENDTRVALPSVAAGTARVAAVVIVLVAAAVVLVSIGAPLLAALSPFVSPGDAANLAPASHALGTHRALVLAWFAGTLVAATMFARASRDGAWRICFATAACFVAITTTLFAATVLRDVADTQSIKPFITAAVDHTPDDEPLYYYPGPATAPDLAFFKTFEYAAGFYARRPLRILDRIDVPASGAVSFIVSEPTLERLENDVDEGSTPKWKLNVLARFTYGENALRTPVAFVEARLE